MQPTDFRRYVRAHLPPLDIRAEREAEIIDELALQLESAYDAAIAGGASDDEAMACADAEVPDWASLARTLTRIETHDARATPSPAARLEPARGGYMSGFARDSRHAVRHLMRSGAYAVIAIATLAFGLGLATAAFSLIDGVLLRPLPYPAADRLVLLKATVPPEGRETVEITFPDAQDISTIPAFDGVAAIMPFAGTTTETEPPSRVEGFEVSPTLFTMLGVGAAAGRTFVTGDSDVASPPVMMISDAYWQRLGAPSDIVGRTMAINEVPRTVIGIVATGFSLELLPGAADVYLPLTARHPLATIRGARAFRVIARLRDGVSREQASAAVAAAGAQLAQAYPDTNQGRTFAVDALQDEIVGGVRSQLWLLAGLVALVMLVAAVNLAGLLLARGFGRSREIALRLALGASRWRLARESLAEGLLISAAGAMLGAALAAAALTLLRTVPGLRVPRLAEVTVDHRAFGALAIGGLIIAVGVAIIPLLLTRRIDATNTLRTGHETTARPAMRLRAALIVGQTSFAFLLLAAAALLATSLRAVLNQPLGFETSQVVTMRIAVPEARYGSRDGTVQFFTELLDALRGHPSVQAAGVASNLPLAGNTGSTLSIQGRESIPLAMRPTVGWNWSSPGFFAALGMPIIRGRDFTPADVSRTPHVTVINETLARLHFGGEDPIGRRVYFGGFGPGGPPEWHEVVGVVGDVRHRTLEAAPDARAYDLFGQHWGRTVSLAVRTPSSPAQTAALARQLVADRDPQLAVFAVRTAADLVGAAVATRRMLAWLVAAFAVVGLAVALVGLYGTLSYIVTERTRELGVRVALGATPSQIRSLVVSRGLQLVTVGVVLGIGASLALRQTIESQLYGITALNVPALAIAAASLLGAACLASLVPAMRAVRIDPVRALRAD